MTLTANKLISQLPPGDQSRLLATAQPVMLALEQVLHRGGDPIRHVYFPIDAFISIVTLIGAKPVLEIGMVGFEGMLGLPLVLGVSGAPFHAVVQGAGLALRVGKTAFLEQLSQSVELERVLKRYIHVSMVQLATSAACLSMHSLSPRLARWLLMTQDRARSKRFRVTHEFLAYMLGVRRVGITLAATALQGRGLIQYQRGDMTILDRRGLQTAACTCYAADRKTYASVLG